DVPQPRFRVAIPILPAMTLAPDAGNSDPQNLRLSGTEGEYTVVVTTRKLAEPTDERKCADAAARLLQNTAGVPAREDWLATRSDSGTYLIIYAIPLADNVQLNAYLLSAAEGTHCIQVHARQRSTHREDVPVWIKGFRGATIEPGKAGAASSK